MVITIKAKRPGLWNVYKSEGLITNRPAGVVRRVAGEVPAYYFYADGSHTVDPDCKMAMTSDPKRWANSIKQAINAMERTPDPA